MNKREFLKTSALSIAGVSMGVEAFTRDGAVRKSAGVRMGICADLHQDIIHDAPWRLNEFVKEMEKRKPDFIIQMGDFCRPIEKNRELMALWNQFSGAKHHVIGNHDMDGGFSRDQVVDFWQAKGKYYAFDLNGYHFVVLDTNENEYNHLKNPLTKYGSFVGDDQLQWLENDLMNTGYPTIIFCHHGLDNDMTGVENASKVRFILESVNRESKFKKVQVVFSGHHHQDYVNVINDIHYVQINSMSYKWLGTQYSHIPYTEEINRQHPLVKHTVPYKDPLWAFVEIANGTLTLHGRKSQFMGSSPEDLGVSKYENIYPIVPFISDKTIRLV